MATKIPERKRSKFRGRKTDHTFLRLPHYVIRSAQWRALSGNAVKFLIELASAYDGSNNGDLAFTRRQALERGWKSGGTRDRAAEEVVEAGFALVTRQGGRHSCSLYAITWEAIDEVGKGVMYAPEHKPSRLWEQRKPLPRDRANVAPWEGKR
jgi:hypothetical protein